MSQTEGSESSQLAQDSKIENIDEVTRQVAISIPADTVANEFALALDKLQKTAHLKGFRPGKAPRDLIKKTHGPRLQFDVADRLINQSLQQVIKGMSETVIGQPSVELDKFEPGDAISFTAKMEVWPEPAIAGYKSVDVSVVKREVSSEQIDKVVKKFLESKASLTAIEGRQTVVLGDVVDAELLELKNGEPGEEREPFVVPVGENMLPEELEQALIGMHVGSEKDVYLALGKNQSQKEEGEQKPNYRLLVKDIKSRILPEITDEFIKAAALPGIETVLEFRSDITKKLEKEVEGQQAQDLNIAIIDKLIAANQFKVPSILVDDEIKSMISSIGGSQDRQIDTSKLNIEQFRPAFSEQAIKRVRGTIIIDRIAELENLKASDEDFSKHCEMLAVEHDTSLDKVREILDKGDTRLAILMNLTRDRVLTYLRGNAVVTYSEPSSDSSSTDKE